MDCFRTIQTKVLNMKLLSVQYTSKKHEMKDPHLRCNDAFEDSQSPSMKIPQTSGSDLKDGEYKEGSGSDNSRTAEIV